MQEHVKEMANGTTSALRVSQNAVNPFLSSRGWSGQYQIVFLQLPVTQMTQLKHSLRMRKSEKELLERSKRKAVHNMW